MMGSGASEFLNEGMIYLNNKMPRQFPAGAKDAIATLATRSRFWYRVPAHPEGMLA